MNTCCICCVCLYHTYTSLSLQMIPSSFPNSYWDCPRKGGRSATACSRRWAFGQCFGTQGIGTNAARGSRCLAASCQRWHLGKSTAEGRGPDGVKGMGLRSMLGKGMVVWNFIWICLHKPFTAAWQHRSYSIPFRGPKKSWNHCFEITLKDVRTHWFCNLFAFPFAQESRLGSQNTGVGRLRSTWLAYDRRIHNGSGDSSRDDDVLMQDVAATSTWMFWLVKKSYYWKNRAGVFFSDAKVPIWLMLKSKIWHESLLRTPWA